MYNTFLLSYDPLMVDPTPTRLVEFVRSNAYTYQYLAPFLGTVFIKSGAAGSDLVTSFNPFIRPSSFVLTQIFPWMTTGLLPQQYWDWINSAAPPPLPGQAN